MSRVKYECQLYFKHWHYQKGEGFGPLHDLTVISQYISISSSVLHGALIPWEGSRCLDEKRSSCLNIFGMLESIKLNEILTARLLRTCEVLVFCA